MKKFIIENCISDKAFEVLKKLKEEGNAEFRDPEFDTIEAFKNSFVVAKNEDIERFKKRNFGGTLKFIKELSTYDLVELNYDSWHQTWYITKKGLKILDILLNETIYTYKGIKYKILESITFKNPNTREWVESFIYQQINSGLKFVREQKEFLKLFKKVKENELDCPFDFTSRCTMDRCDCKPKTKK